MKGETMKRLLIVAAWLLGVVCAFAQEAGYPSHAVRIVVNVTPGGGVDVAARIIADKLSKKFGQPFVVENRVGAAGNLASDYVFRSPPDGYTLLASPGAALSLNDLLFKNLPFSPQALKPVSLLTSVPLALIVRPNFPANNFNEFLAYVKANPNKLNFASNGTGTAGHLTGELFMVDAGVKMTHVPYKGTGPVLNDIIAGHVDLTFIQYSAFFDLYKAGRAKILAVASKKRLDNLPEVPTLAELGFPNIVSETWNVLAAPPNIPATVLNKLNVAVDEALKMPDVRERFEALQTTVEGGSLDEAQKYLTADREKWKKVIEAAGIQPE
jgi:tripartite-type tricarboxylate transporter receptor subunit TctC